MRSLALGVLVTVAWALPAAAQAPEGEGDEAPAVEGEPEAGEPQAEPEADSETEAESQPESEAESEPASEAEGEPEPEADSETEAEPEPAPADAPASEPAPASESGGESEPEPGEGAAPEAGKEPEHDHSPGSPASTAPIRYFVEGIEVRGNTRTKTRVIKRFVPLEHGDVLDVDDPEIQSIRWRLLGTGWFDDVRLRLKRAKERGWVVLVVEVEERNTLVIRQVTLGISEGLNNSLDESGHIVPYGGLSVAERNLLGLGIELSATVFGSEPQQGAELGFADPTAFGSEFLLSASVFFNNAREFFGRDPLVSIECSEGESDCPPEVEAKNAVVLYRRGGWSLGTGHDLGANTRYTLDWRGELVNVRVRPDAASERRGDEVRPIDFAIQDGKSFVSLLRVGLLYDKRNDPGLPTEGVLVRFLGDGGTRLLGSDYDFLRLQGLARLWFPLPWEHHVRLGAYAGVVFGDPPFFYKFHVSDLTDLIPSRVLGMQLDRRPPPNLLGTSVEVMRQEEIAGRVDVEYGFHLYRGGKGFFRAVTAYGGVGLYALAGFEDVQVAIPGYEGASRIPIDLTFDVGLRADTQIGVFQFGFSSLLGFIAL